MQNHIQEKKPFRSARNSILIISTLCCIAMAMADRLDNVYLPPTNSRTSGGSGNILKTPFNQGSLLSGRQPYTGNLEASQAGNTYGAPQPSSIKSFAAGPTQPPAAILRFNNDNNGEGTYQFDFETENKIFQQESGQLKNAGTDQESNVVQGSYSYVGPDGQTYTINYVADELGFRATGDHLPVAPEIPAEILKSLEQNAADEARGIVDDGQYRPDPSEGINRAQVNRQYLAPKVQGGYQQQQGYKY